MNNQEKHKQKYLKYKEKYLQLKNSVGGNFIEINHPERKPSKDLKIKINSCYERLIKSRGFTQNIEFVKNEKDLILDVAIDIPYLENFEIPTDGLKCTYEDCKKHNELKDIFIDYKKFNSQIYQNVIDAINRLEEIHKLCKCNSYLDRIRF
jgi:hypothetical protein